MSLCKPIAHARAIWDSDYPWLCLRGGTTQIIHYVLAQNYKGNNGNCIPVLIFKKLEHSG